VPQLIDDLRNSGVENIWWDKELSGGQSWWDTILEQIRDADILVCLVDQGARDSLAVTREYKYANDLGKTILPVLVSSEVRVEEFPVELAGKQYVDYRPGNRNAFRDLHGAISNLPLSPPLPHPLPPAPELPRSELDYLSDRLNSPERLNLEAQNAVFNQLRRYAKSDDRQARAFAQEGLQLLSKRDELNANVAADISALSQKEGRGKSVAAMVLFGLIVGAVALFGWFQRNTDSKVATTAPPVTETEPVIEEPVELEPVLVVEPVAESEPAIEVTQLPTISDTAEPLEPEPISIVPPAIVKPAIIQPVVETEPAIETAKLPTTPDTEKPVETEPTAIVQPVAEIEPAIEVEEVPIIPGTNTENFPETQKPIARVEWHQDFSVFEETPFDLCGHSAFTVKGDANGSELIVRSRDRTIPDTPFRGLESRITNNETTELFTGCRVLFNYSVTGSVARIRVRSNKEK